MKGKKISEQELKKVVKAVKLIVTSRNSQNA